jgi:hypothetical protein
MFNFISVEDGSEHSAMFEGEAMDSGDKATGKACSNAFKLAMLESFCIPTGGDNDIDASTPPQIAAEREPPPAIQQASRDPAIVERIEQCADLESLRLIWKDLSVADRKLYDGDITKRRNRMTARAATE